MPISRRGIARSGISRRGIATAGISVVDRQCWAYNFDGVDDRGQLAFRAINPGGDIDIEWGQAAENKPDGSVIVSQCGSGSNSTQEFRLTRLAEGDLEIILGGAQTTITTAQGYSSTGRFKLTFIGSALSLFKDDVLVHQRSFTRGTAREPSAVTSIGTRPTGASSFTNFFRGTLYDIRINGTLWPMADRNQALQLPVPSGLGAELSNINGTWVGNGAAPATKQADTLVFSAVPVNGGIRETGLIGAANNQTYLLEYEVFDYAIGVARFVLYGSGQQVLSANRSGNGVYREILTINTAGGSFSNSLLLQGVGATNTFKIRNISLRPLWVAGAVELSSNRPGGNFINTGANVVAIGSGTELTTNDITVEPNTMYQVAPIGGPMTRSRWQWKRASDQTWQWGASNLDYGTTDATVDAARVFRTPAGADAIRIYFKFDTGTVTGISVRKLDSLCNPMTLVNTNPDRWQPIPCSLRVNTDPVGVQSSDGQWVFTSDGQRVQVIDI